MSSSVSNQRRRGPMHAQAAITRERVLLAAADVFGTRGYTATSVSDIVRAAGTTSGSMYFHFGSKEAMAAAVVQAQYDRWPAVVERFTDASGPGRELVCLVALSFAVGRAFRDDPLIRGGVRLSLERAVIPFALPVPFVGWIETVTELLAAARAAGQVSDTLDPPTAARLHVAAFFGVQYVSDALHGREDLEARLTDMWLGMLPAWHLSMDEHQLVEQARALCAQLDGEQEGPVTAARAPEADHGRTGTV
ncbi:ScbR family autoregulator-binding transcription factor [Streptacidiphilus sp. EB103A]|uniref:ScbR family autoregulator-binding transcription factor n=1 Tax=Streptacidiphilus sp. EB103A TaxID=3156275 RepID=UPI003515B51A